MADRVERVGNTVWRPMGYWSPAVHDLLRHLEGTDFPAPRVLRAEGGVETLTWIDGESGSAGWAKVVPEFGLRNWGRFLRSYHDAVAGYRPPAYRAWSSGEGGCGAGEIICHGDFGPWNGIWRGDEVVGLIDWDHARPARPLFDLAYGLEYAVPFRGDEECVRWLRYPAPPDRRRRIEVFCDAYGMPVPDDVSAAVAWEQRLDTATCEAIARRGIEPQATWVRDGYLVELQARIAWTEASGLYGLANKSPARGSGRRNVHSVRFREPARAFLRCWRPGTGASQDGGMTTSRLGPWEPAAPDEVAEIFSACGARWWIAGGYAIELAAGRALREHGDIDVLLLRPDQLAAQRALPGWQWHAADPPGTLRPWRPAELLPAGVHDIWCRPGPGQPWRIQVMLDESCGGDWVARRDERIRRPVSTIGMNTPRGIPYLVPEIQLFCKAGNPRPKDEADFAAALPVLTRVQRKWLSDAISVVYGPAHPWLACLIRSGGPPAGSANR